MLTEDFRFFRLMSNLTPEHARRFFLSLLVDRRRLRAMGAAYSGVKHMGLDMYAYTRDTKPEKEVDFVEDDNPAAWDAWVASNFDDAKAPYFYYWRKHPNLHGFMEMLYYEKGGADEHFVGPVLLTLEDLDRLENALLVYELPETTGFFFGESDCRGELPTDLEFVAKARKAISEGKYVYYTSSW